MELPVPYQWVIGYWNGTFWKLPGSGVEFADSYFENIDEVPRNVSAEIEATIRG
jgi:hypothetical protein